jgi:formyltetrahydrofolate synthetase
MDQSASNARPDRHAEPSSDAKSIKLVNSGTVDSAHALSRSDLDPTQLEDWEIAQAAEGFMKPIALLAQEWGVSVDEIVPFGRQLAKVDYPLVMERLADRPVGKYIDVTAITPTPLGEGKTTTVIGLIEGLGKLGKRVSGAIRQPSGGPTFNVKGSAAGGGLAQCIPLAPLSLGLTGDIDAITHAHNLAMVALTARMQHEHNYDDATLARRGLTRLDIDPDKVHTKWVMDFCAQALRNIRIGRGGKMDGLEMDSGFAISVSSELMAILAVSKDLGDMRSRIARMVLAQNRQGGDVTAADLEVDGAMAAWMVKTLNPNLIQTLEGQPVLVHAGPFANIAIGQSSIIADLLGTRLSEFHVTESGFGSDIGYEKFWNLKCRTSGLRPDAVVVVATIRALKMHGGGPAVKPGVPLDEAYTSENIALVERGCDNLIAHLEIVKKSGIRPVVCINHFHTDTEAEIALVCKIAKQNGAYAAVSKHWLKGGDGAVELAKTVLEACDNHEDFGYLYEEDTPLREALHRLACDVYGAEGVSYSAKAEEKLSAIESHNGEYRGFGICMAKTHLSLSHDPTLKGRPTGWTLPIRDFMIYKGAKLIVPLAGEIKLMPGTASNPAYRRIDVNIQTGQVTGLF